MILDPLYSQHLDASTLMQAPAGPPSILLKARGFCITWYVQYPVWLLSYIIDLFYLVPFFMCLLYLALYLSYQIHLHYLV